MLKFIRRILTVDATIPSTPTCVYVNKVLGNVVFRRIDCLRDSLYNWIFYKTFAFGWRRIDDNTFRARVRKLCDKFYIWKEHRWFRNINKKINKLNHAAKEG